MSDTGGPEDPEVARLREQLAAAERAAELRSELEAAKEELQAIDSKIGDTSGSDQREEPAATEVVSQGRIDPHASPSEPTDLQLNRERRYTEAKTQGPTIEQASDSKTKKRDRSDNSPKKWVVAALLGVVAAVALVATQPWESEGQQGLEVVCLSVSPWRVHVGVNYFDEDDPSLSSSLVEIDFGDGGSQSRKVRNQELIDGVGYTHAYAVPGTYEIEVQREAIGAGQFWTKGCTISLGDPDATPTEELSTVALLSGERTAEVAFMLDGHFRQVDDSDQVADCVIKELVNIHGSSAPEIVSRIDASWTDLVDRTTGTHIFRAVAACFDIVQDWERSLVANGWGNLASVSCAVNYEGAEEDIIGIHAEALSTNGQLWAIPKWSLKRDHCQ